MASPTTNKAYTYPAHGGGVGTWDTNLNGNFEYQDLNLGGYYQLTCSSTTAAVTFNSTYATIPSTATSITFSASLAQNMFYNLTGARSQSLSINMPAVGSIYCFANTSSGVTTTTVLPTGGSGVTLPQSGQVIVTTTSTGANYANNATADRYTVESKSAQAVLDLFRNSSNPTNNDVVAAEEYNGRNSVGTKVNYGAIYATAQDVVSGSEDGLLTFKVMVAGVLTDRLYLGTTVAFFPSGGISVVGDISGDTASGSMIATQAQQETGTATTVLVTPGRQQSHKSAAKAWVFFTLSGTTVSFTAADAYNVTSVTRNSVGVYTIVFTTAFSNTNYTFVFTCGGVVVPGGVSKSVGSVQFATLVPETGGNREASFIHFVAYGDQ